MNEMQEKVKEVIQKYGLKSSTEVCMIDLVSEVGELGKEVLKGDDYGRKSFSITDNVESELGDVLFSLMCIASNMDISLETALNGVLLKYEKRFQDKGNIESGN